MQPISWSSRENEYELSEPKRTGMMSMTERTATNTTMRYWRPTERLCHYSLTLPHKRDLDVLM